MLTPAHHFRLLDRSLPDREFLKALGYVFRPKGRKTERKRSSLTIGEAAEYLGRTKTEISRIVQETKRRQRHGLPDPNGIRFSQRIGKGGWLRFELADLDAWKAALTVDPALVNRIPTKSIRQQQRANQSPTGDLSHW
jgi:plasmid maintenance system antidote protein VapI